MPSGTSCEKGTVEPSEASTQVCEPRGGSRVRCTSKGSQLSTRPHSVEASTSTRRMKDMPSRNVPPARRHTTAAMSSGWTTRRRRPTRSGGIREWNPVEERMNELDDDEAARPSPVTLSSPGLRSAYNLLDMSASRHIIVAYPTARSANKRETVS